MRPKSRGLLPTLFLLIWCGPSRGEDDPVAANAALIYWPACAWFRSMELSEPEREILRNPLTAPLDEATGRLIDRGRGFLRDLHRGAALPRCEWGIDFSEGFGTLLPHMDLFRPSTRLLLLDARQAFQRGDSGAAAADLGTALVVSRHLGADPSIVGFAVQMVQQEQALKLVAEHFGAMDVDGLRRLSDRIDNLPATKSLSERVAFDKLCTCGWLRRTIDKSGAQEAAAELRTLGQGKGEDYQAVCDARIQAIFAENEERLSELIDEAERLYDEVAEWVKQPPDELDAELAAQRTKLEQAGPLARFWLEDLDVGSLKELVPLRRREARSQTELVMLRAAIAIARGGPDEIQKFPDPYGNGPLKLLRSDQGFLLVSKLLIDDRPFAIRFQRPLP